MVGEKVSTFANAKTPAGSPGKRKGGRGITNRGRSIQASTSRKGLAERSGSNDTIAAEKGAREGTS